MEFNSKTYQHKQNVNMLKSYGFNHTESKTTIKTQAKAKSNKLGDLISNWANKLVRCSEVKSYKLWEKKICKLER